jgi:uncharacterized repeat protein (TIGR01451 family)
MNSPICVTNICVTNRKQTASVRIVSLMLTIVPLWMMMAVVVSVHGQTSATDTSPDWTQFHRNNMQRWNPYETAIGVGNAGNLQLKWKNPLGGNSGVPESEPAVVNGVVYFGSTDGNVYALNASTGAKLWSFAIGNLGSSSPAVSHGVVYIGSNGGTVYALNANTGAKLWTYAAGVPVATSPAVSNGVVYIGSNDETAPINDFFALNASTGVLLWSFSGVGPPTSFSSPAVANGVVYVAAGDELDRSYDLYALNASTGATLWSFQSGAFFASPGVANGVVYIGSLDGNVYALNASTGVLLWNYLTGGAEFSFSSPAIANGVVYVGSDDGNVYALNAATGTKLWSYDNGISVDSSPAVANGVVYIGSSDGNVHALNASTGAKLWSYDSGNSVPSSPIIVDGVVYFRGGAAAPGEGDLYAFSIGADLFLRVQPSLTTVAPGDLLTYAFPVWNLGPDNALEEVLNTQVPAGTTFDYIRISGTPGLGTCTHPPYQGTGQIVCHENASMAPNTTWTVRLTVKVTAPSGTVITESATTTEDTPDPNLANNTATVSITVQ